MSQLGKYKTKRFYLPTTKHLPEAEQDWVELRSTITAADVIAMNLRGDSVQEQTAEGLSRTITDWSFTEPDGSKSPIDYEHVCMLEQADFDFIKVLDKENIEGSQEGLSVDEKKTSSDTLEADKPSPTTQIPVSSPPSM